jgi:hypothetical protein
MIYENPLRAEARSIVGRNCFIAPLGRAAGIAPLVSLTAQ